MGYNSRMAALLLLLAAAAGPPARWSFERDVRPILRAHCTECHGEAPKFKGGLDLRLRRAAVAHGAVVPGRPKDSPLWQHVNAGKMPPGKVKLSPRDADALRGWIAAGAPVARPEPAKVPPGAYYTDDDRSHWAYRPLAQVARSIDELLLDRLHANDLTFAPQADRYTLLRRVAFTLTGLPPTPDEVIDFITDLRPDAYERLVDRLLASPAYGERWGRHWLDVAGYADSHGYSGADPVRPHAWKYRDWVVRALNADMPLDRFIIEQLAGDELAGASRDAHAIERLTATGFLRTAPDGTATPGTDTSFAANQNVADTVQIVGTALLGMTMHCAQCHNHRYDPIPQADYYRLRAVFEPALDPSAWRGPMARRISLLSDFARERSARIESEARKLDRARAVLQAEHIERVLLLQLAKVPEADRAAVEAARRSQKRTKEQDELLRKYPFTNVTPGSLYLYDRKAANELEAEAKKAAALRATKPHEDFIDALTEVPGKVPVTKVFHRGDPALPREAVPPGAPSILGLPAIADKDAARPTTGRRLAFARLVVSGKHPLTARVLANRVWMHHFGRGIVSTPGDFGVLGSPPSHPELLDKLADELMRGWSLKRLHRLILTSAAFRQGWRDSADARRIDPDNVLLWRAPLRRLEAEALRDALLSVSGVLYRRIGGSPVPVMPDLTGRIIIGLDRRDGAGYLRGDPVDLREEQYRRGLYIQARRSMVLSSMEPFDPATPSPCTERRLASTAPQQALMMLNSFFVGERSRGLAARVMPESTTEARIRLAWLIALGKPITPDEAADAAAFVRRQSALVGEKAALELFCQAVLASNAFLYID